MKVYVLLGVLAFAALTLAEDCEFEGDQWTVAPERYQETFYQSGKFMRRWAKKIVNGGVFITMTGHCVDAGDVGDECDATADSTCGDGRTCCATGFHAVG